MIEQTPFIPVKPPRHRKRRPAPYVEPQTPRGIVSVAHGAANNEIVVTFVGTLLAIAEAQDGLAVMIGAVRHLPDDAIYTFPQQTATFAFAVDVSGATTWSVPNPATWEFAEGPMLPPFSGDIA